MFDVDEVVTRIKVSVVFDNGNIAAGRTEDTQRMFLVEGRSGGLFEYLHSDPPDILVPPLVEDGAEESSPGFGRHADGAAAALGVRLRLDQGQEGYVLGVDLLEESVDPEGGSDVMRVYHAQDIGVDSVHL